MFFDVGSFPVEKVMVKRIPISKLKFPLAKIPSPTGGELTLLHPHRIKKYPRTTDCIKTYGVSP